MSLLKSLKNPNIREVPVELTAQGEKVSVTVKYASQSVKELREREAALLQRREKGQMFFLSEFLQSSVKEIIEADGTVIKVTPDLLESMDVANLKAIETAIGNNTDPK